MKKRYIPISILLFYVSLKADNIEIINHTQSQIWAGMYYINANILGQSLGPAVLHRNVFQIDPNKKIKIERPAWQFRKNRELIFSDDRNYLKTKFTEEEYKRASKTPAGWKHGTKYHIVETHNILRGYCDVNWNLLQPLITASKEIFNKLVNDAQKTSTQHKYGQAKATVRQGTDLAEEEREYLTNRLPKVKEALEEILNLDLYDDEVPVISVCMSGGGMRAAMLAEGFFEGLQSIGLLNALTYAAALSGSTWFLSNFIELNWPIEKYQKHFIQALCKAHTFTPKALTFVLLPLLTFKRHISIIDVYGVFLANTFFHNIEDELKRQNIHLSNSQRYLKDGNSVFPLYTAVESFGDDFHWLTFTPYEIGCDDWEMNIPTWAFGRKFSAGESTDFAPEQTLGFLMGTWGSALSGTIKHIYNQIKSGLNTILAKALEDFFIESGVADISFAAIKIFNPLYGVKPSPMQNIKRLPLMDAGYDYNLPIPPLVKKERKIDIIIILDASQNVHEGSPALQKAIKELKKRNIYFPQINFSTIAKNQISVFTDKNNPKLPTIIFFAPVKNENYDKNFDPEKKMTSTYATTKFIYKEEDVKRMSGLIRQNVIDNKNIIYEAIRSKINQKKSLS